MRRQRVYLDYAATSPLCKDVLRAMQPYFFQRFGNPSSIHSFGQEAAAAVEKARQKLADFLGCGASEIIFTSGATESNNLVIKGTVRAARQAGLKMPHIIVSQIEHPCVLESARSLKKDGLAQVSYLGVDKDGMIKIGELEKLIKENTILVSVMYVNNEVGVIEPLAQVAKIIKEKNKGRKRPVLFHTDAVQAANYLDCRVEELGVDFLSLSAHKFYGPKGVGAFYIKKGSAVRRIQDGGSHEFGMRAGTLNVPGIVGMGEAISKIKNKKPRSRTNSLRDREKIKDIERLRDRLIDGILKKIPRTYLNGSREQRVANNVNIRFEGAEGEAIVMALDLEGVACSTASACASGSLKPSHVLLAMGLGASRAHSSVRFTLGRQTSNEEIDYVLKVLPPIVVRLRSISGGAAY